MIKTDIISQFPLQVITEQQQASFLEHKRTLLPYIQRSFTKLIILIDAYLYSSEKKLSLKSFNSEVEISELTRGVVAFIYQYVEGGYYHKYNLSRYVINLMQQIAKHGLVILEPPNLSKRVIHKDVKKLINDLSYINENKLSFYRGWYIEDNKGKERAVEMSFIREAYGEKVTNQLYEALKKHCRTNKEKTVETHLKHFKGLFRYFIELTPSFQKLKKYLKSDVAIYYLSTVFNVELNKHIVAEGNGDAFVRSWSNKMYLYREFLIGESIFEEPMFPLPKPKFNQAITIPGSHNKKDKKVKDSSGIFNNKLITKISLKYTDNEAIREIIKDIRLDIGHVLIVSEKSAKLNFKRLERFHKSVKLASPKMLGENRSINSIDEKQSIACATFNRYLWNHPGKEGGYASFLGYNDDTKFLNKLLCIPTLHVLYPLILMLIHEHPKITESWLINWQLYNEGGKPYGYIQSGNSWIIRSFKNRAGMNSAEQSIPLNDISKVIVDKILSHTKIARDYLKSQDHDDYRYTLLTASLGKKPAKLNQITNLKKITSKSIFTKLLTSKSTYVTNNRAKEITDALTVNRMRASTGVEIFLITNSVKKMCKALGHKEKRADLVERYLPSPILKFFADRWILIFQNAIVFEAMKDSEYLYDAIDISPKSLDEFLKNHQLPSMKGHIFDGNTLPTEGKLVQQEGAVIISTPLLRVLLFFFYSSTDNISRIGFSTDLIKTWTQMATLIITQIEYQLSSPGEITEVFDSDVMAMYHEAKIKPATFIQFQ